MTSKARQIVYGITAVVGIIVTWYFNIQFMQHYEGFSIGKFISDCYANAAASSISNDISVAAFTFLFWSYFEARKIEMKNWWVYAVLTFGVAIAFAFPLFMLMRERQLSKLEESKD